MVRLEVLVFASRGTPGWRFVYGGHPPVPNILADADGGTEVLAVHDGLPPGLPTADNEAGWRSSLGKLAALAE
jgi:hypothetical protein